MQARWFVSKWYLQVVNARVWWTAAESSPDPHHWLYWELENERKEDREREKENERAVAYAGGPKGFRPPAVAADFRSAGSFPRMRPFFPYLLPLPSLLRFSHRTSRVSSGKLYPLALRYLEVQLSRTAGKKKKYEATHRNIAKKWGRPLCKSIAFRIASGVSMGFS